MSGIQWPCYDENHPGELFLARAPVGDAGARTESAVPSGRVRAAGGRARRRISDLPLTTGRRLDSFNTGVQSGQYSSPLRRAKSLDLSPQDAARYGVAEGEVVRVSLAPRVGRCSGAPRRHLRPGLAFMTFHFDVPTNVLTIDANDPKSGTAEFKATAIRVDKIDRAEVTGSASVAGSALAGSASVAGSAVAVRSGRKLGSRTLSDVAFT